jgi:hypothetical protein
VANLNKFHIWSVDRYVPADVDEGDDQDIELPEDLMEWLDEAEEN